MKWSQKMRNLDKVAEKMEMYTGKPKPMKDPMKTPMKKKGKK